MNSSAVLNYAFQLPDMLADVFEFDHYKRTLNLWKQANLIQARSINIIYFVYLLLFIEKTKLIAGNSNVIFFLLFSIM